jgi:hypothetical protein
VIEKQGMQKEEAETSEQRDSHSILRRADNGWLRAGSSQSLVSSVTLQHGRKNGREPCSASKPSAHISSSRLAVPWRTSPNKTPSSCSNTRLKTDLGEVTQMRPSCELFVQMCVDQR